MRVYLGEEMFAGRFADILLEIGIDDYPSFDEIITIPENLCTVVITVQDLISKIQIGYIWLYPYIVFC